MRFRRIKNEIKTQTNSDYIVSKTNSSIALDSERTKDIHTPKQQNMQLYLKVEEENEMKKVPSKIKLESLPFYA